MATIEITPKQLSAEASLLLKKNPNILKSVIYSDGVFLDKHTKTISKVNGKFPSIFTVMTSVVQGFTNEWSELGKLLVENKELTTYHQKVNYAVEPREIIGSYLTFMDQENKAVNQQPISKYILENILKPAIVRDLNYLSVKGVYDGSKLKKYGHSLNGLESILNIASNQNKSQNPAFMIPISAITDENIVDEVTKFEDSIPEAFQPHVNKIFMSYKNLRRYKKKYKDTFGDNQFENNEMRTRDGREIVGVPLMTVDTIFGTVADNFVNTIDKFDNAPNVEDIQVQDYKVKFLIDFYKGYDFAINQLVFISQYSSTRYGLGDKDLNQKFFQIDGITP